MKSERARERARDAGAEAEADAEHKHNISQLFIGCDVEWPDTKLISESKIKN